MIIQCFHLPLLSRLPYHKQLADLILSVYLL
nr:MAG TPA: hypothetical protein [Caudoviricetes sp.]